MTLVQFDGQNPQEVVLDGVDVGTVPSLQGRFEPRGSTPLFDALGQMLDRAEAAGGVGADQLVVVLTDGEENASRRWTREAVFDRISRLQEQGWTFVFLGANQDSYATGAALGVQSGSTSNFRADREGVARAYDGLSRATASGGARAAAAEAPTATGSGVTGRKPKNCRRSAGAARQLDAVGPGRGGTAPIRAERVGAACCLMVSSRR